MNNIIENIKWSLKLYSLTLVIPFSMSIINIIFVGILGSVLGIETKFDFLMNFKFIWLNYYYDGMLLDIIAWKWHLALLFIAFIYTIFDNKIMDR